MLNPKASIVTLTYFGAEKTIEGYNAMEVAKAALQSSIRYLANFAFHDNYFPIAP